jgi:hypothetical protein
MAAHTHWGSYPRAWRMILARLHFDEHARQIVRDELGDCADCWKFIAEFLVDYTGNCLVIDHGWERSVDFVEGRIAGHLDALALDEEDRSMTRGDNTMCERCDAEKAALDAAHPNGIPGGYGDRRQRGEGDVEHATLAGAPMEALRSLAVKTGFGLDVICRLSETRQLGQLFDERGELIQHNGPWNGAEARSKLERMKQRWEAQESMPASGMDGRSALAYLNAKRR